MQGAVVPPSSCQGLPSFAGHFCHETHWALPPPEGSWYRSLLRASFVHLAILSYYRLCVLRGTDNPPGDQRPSQVHLTKGVSDRLRLSVPRSSGCPRAFYNNLHISVQGLGM